MSKHKNETLLSKAFFFYVIQLKPVIERLLKECCFFKIYRGTWTFSLSSKNQSAKSSTHPARCSIFPRFSSSLSNDCIQQDTEIQAWILDLHNNGFALREEETDHGIPSSLTSVEQLTHLLTMVIFTCACQHAAVNFSQMDSLGFPPSSPALMRQPPPTEKGKLSMKDMMKSLPSKHQTGVTIVTLYDLTRIYPDEVSKRLLIQAFDFLDLVDFIVSTSHWVPLNYLLWQCG